MKNISLKMSNNFKIELLARNNVYALENNSCKLSIDCEVDPDLAYKLHINHAGEKKFVLMDKEEDSISRLLTSSEIKENGVYYIQVEGIKDDYRIISNQIRLEVGNFINADHIPTPEEQSVIDTLLIKVTSIDEDIDLINSTISLMTNRINGIEEDKQDTLVSGENIATINGQNLLDGGNIEIKGSGSSEVTKEEFDAEVQARIDGDWYISYLNTTKQTITVDDVEMNYSDWCTYALAHPKTIMKYGAAYYYPEYEFTSIWLITFWTITNSYIEYISLAGGVLSINKYELNKIRDVRFGSESLVDNGVASIPKADSTTYGLVKMGSTTFTTVVNTGEYEVKSATGSQIANRNPLTPATTPVPLISTSNIDYAVMKSLTDNKSIYWTDAAKASARERLGITEGSSVDVQINGTSIVEDGVANIPIAICGNSNTGVLGVIRPFSNSFKDVFVGGKRFLQLDSATASAISNRYTGGRPITADNFDFAVKTAMTDGKGAEWTDEEKAMAQQRMGIVTLTREEYNLIDNPSEGTLYVIVG
jgi:hypothetical protein